jgi:hypothetical protein
VSSENDVLASPVRWPRNLSADNAGSIHDDKTAAALGFRGGTVAGSIHMDQFPPLLIEAFGPLWFQTGSLSLYFRNATTDSEPVRAFVQRPPAGATDPAGAADVQVRAWATTSNDVAVCEGTASIGHPAEPSALRGRDLRPVDPSELRMLRQLKPGQSLGEISTTASGERMQASIRQGVMTEPLDWYTGPSPWGAPIASPSAIVDLLFGRLLAGTREKMGPHVGLFGAIEIRFHHGPVLIDHSYTVTGEVVAVSQTPKTEVLWFDSRARDADGVVIADMRMMSRQMKQSSPLYQVQDLPRAGFDSSR